MRSISAWWHTVTLIACVAMTGSVLGSHVPGQSGMARAAMLGLQRLPLSAPDAAHSAALRSSYGRVPLGFDANVGQSDPRVRFLAHGTGYTVFLTATEALLALRTPHAPIAHAAGTQFGPLRPTHASRRSAQEAVPPAPGQPALLRLHLVGATPRPQLLGLERLPGSSNYFLGRDPHAWHRGVPAYARVVYHQVYPGIDLVFYGTQSQLEYDWLLAPGADPGLIRLAVEGAQQVRLDGQGNLVLALRAGAGVLRQAAPVVYQQSGRQRRLIAARYVLRGPNQVGLAVGAYDPRRPLVIDPVLSFSTYLGGSGTDEATGIAVDSAGNAYVVGNTSSADFPTANALQPTCHLTSSGSCALDIFVAKLNASGTALVYSTYLGGSSVNNAAGIAVDSYGDAYVTGQTTSADFPLVHALQQGFNRGSTTCASGGVCLDAVVVELNASGNGLVYSSYLGGSGDDLGTGIAVDSAGAAYVTGTTVSADFPLANAVQSTYRGLRDTFVTKLQLGKTCGRFPPFCTISLLLVYSTYLGGSGEDDGGAIAVDSYGDAYVTGTTCSFDFPTVLSLSSINRGHGTGCSDAFVTKISPSGTTLLYSTYLGGSAYDFGYAIAVDGYGNAFVTGRTFSADFPTANAVQSTYRGGGDAFVAKIQIVKRCNPAPFPPSCVLGPGLAYSTYLGGAPTIIVSNIAYDGEDLGRGIAVDGAGDAYVTGQTNSVNFPIVNALPGSSLNNGHGSASSCDLYSPTPCPDAFVTELSPTGAALLYSTYLGGSAYDAAIGIAVDGAGNAYVAGETGSTDFPTANALQGAIKGNPGNGDAFISKVAPS